MIDPESGANLWDVLRVGTMRSPGVVRLSGNGLQFGWDVQNATGSSGATTRRTGEPLKEFEAEFELSNEVDDLNVSDFDRWDEFQEMLESLVPPNGKPKAADVYHPDLARVHITAVTIGSIGLLSADGRGGGKIRVKFLEYRPPKPVQAKPPAKKTAGDLALEGDNKEIKDLNASFEKKNQEALASGGPIK